MATMATDRYRLSFTTGGLFLQEAPLVAERYLVLRDWSQTRDQVRGDNLLQVRTAAAALRISKELVARLQHLEVPELEELLEASRSERGYLLWAAACRRYAFIRDFAIEVLREHHLLLRHQLSFGDYDSFYNAKALWHTELDDIAPSTQRKLRQNLFRMLREADLVSNQGIIQRALLSPRVAQLLVRRGRDDYRARLEQRVRSSPDPPAKGAWNRFLGHQARVHAVAGRRRRVRGRDLDCSAIPHKAKESLADNDGHSFFEALGDQVVTGPTLTNVNDFRAILIEAPAKG